MAMVYHGQEAFYSKCISQMQACMEKGAEKEPLGKPHYLNSYGDQQAVWPFKKLNLTQVISYSWK